jgi:hypothetical protein
MNVARYFFVCNLHGGCGSTAVQKSSETSRACPVCGATAEVWIGTQAPPHTNSSPPELRAG